MIIITVSTIALYILTSRQPCSGQYLQASSVQGTSRRTLRSHPGLSKKYMVIKVGWLCQDKTMNKRPLSRKLLVVLYKAILVQGNVHPAICIKQSSSSPSPSPSPSSLGRGSNNQNGNLRWYLPWRGGGLECHIPILKYDFFENHLESFPDCENVFCT